MLELVEAGPKWSGHDFVDPAISRVAPCPLTAAPYGFNPIQLVGWESGFSRAACARY